MALERQDLVELVDHAGRQLAELRALREEAERHVLLTVLPISPLGYCWIKNKPAELRKGGVPPGLAAEGSAT